MVERGGVQERRERERERERESSHPSPEQSNRYSVGGDCVLAEEVCILTVM